MASSVGEISGSLLKEYRGKSLPFSLDNQTMEIPYITRVDPISGNVSKISEERAARKIGTSVELNLKPVERCEFCALETSTPRERIKHGCGAISVPNKHPWEKYDWITLYPPFGRHKLLLSDLYFDDLERMTESSYDLASICARDAEVIGFMDFTNWGTFAGASQQHPHSQRKSITFVPDPIQEREMHRCKELYEYYGRNPFDLLEEEELSQGTRVIYCKQVFIASAFAPTCPDEVIIFPRQPISHILQTTSFERRNIIDPVLGVFPALFFYRGVTDLNIVVHMAPFKDMEQARKYYRWHMHIYPRRPRLPVDRAGAEIGFETDVIDVLPENSAAALRSWYIEGPKEELVAKLEDGSPPPRLLQELRRLMTAA